MATVHIENGATFLSLAIKAWL